MWPDRSVCSMAETATRSKSRPRSLEAHDRRPRKAHSEGRAQHATVIGERVAIKRIESATEATPSGFSEAVTHCSLSPLTPSYEESEHALYVNAIEVALTGKDKAVILNIAL